jgi:glycosyltransferase involved in cell wall biosynthesis
MFAEPDKYLIGRAFWETDKVPLDFAINLQRVDEIWTGSEFNKQAMINAGVTKDIYIIPEAIDARTSPAQFDPYITENKDDYKFYSIFEWTERKNPLALLEAYWREFEDTEGVSLTLKTYQISFGPDKREGIDQQIRKLKARLNLKRFAPIYMYRQLMDRRQVYRFHKSFDCFVSAHRGEGWGIPQMEALLMEKPIISTNLGGIHEYLTHKKDALLVDYTMVPVDNLGYNGQWYTPDQKWGAINIDSLRKNMRWVFENKSKAETIGKAGRKLVVSKFDLPVVGAIMLNRLKTITDGFTTL